MKHIKLFEQFLSEVRITRGQIPYSSSDMKKLEEFAEELSDEIRDQPLNYLEDADFSPENFLEYITGEGQGDSLSIFGADKSLKTAADVIKKYNDCCRSLTVRKLRKQMGF